MMISSITSPVQTLSDLQLFSLKINGLGIGVNESEARS